jgi:hypothetical protein
MNTYLVAQVTFVNDDLDPRNNHRRIDPQSTHLIRMKLNSPVIGTLHQIEKRQRTEPDHGNFVDYVVPNLKTK